MNTEGHLRARASNISIQTLRALVLKEGSLFSSAASTDKYLQLESVCEHMMHNAKREERSIFVDIEGPCYTNEKQLLEVVEIYLLRHISKRNET